MKKQNSPMPSGGRPLSNEDLIALEQQVYIAIESLYGAVAGAWIVSGCTASNINTVAKTCRLSAGYVWLAGELRYFPGYVGAYPVYVVAANDTYETRRFQNGVIQNVYVTKSATATTVQPSSGVAGKNTGGTDPQIVENFLTFNPSNLNLRLVPIITSGVAADLATETTARQATDTVLQTAITTEATTRQTADTALQNTITALTAVVATKQTQQTTRIPWTNLPISNPGYTSTENASDPNPNVLSSFRASYMRTEDGIVHLRGYIKGDGGGYVCSGTLPAEVRPPKTVTFKIPYVIQSQDSRNLGQMFTNVMEIAVDSAGNMTHSTYVAAFGQTQRPSIGANPSPWIQYWFHLDGLNYSVQ